MTKVYIYVKARTSRAAVARNAVFLAHLLGPICGQHDEPDGSWHLEHRIHAMAHSRKAPAHADDSVQAHCERAGWNTPNPTPHDITDHSMSPAGKKPGDHAPNRALRTFTAVA